MDSIHLIFHCTFRLKQFFNIFFPSAFVRNPNSSIPWDIILKGDNCLTLSLFFFENFGYKLWHIIQKRTYSWYLWWWGSLRGQKQIQLHFCCYVLVFLTICFHSDFTFIHFKSCSCSKNSQFYCFPDLISFHWCFLSTSNFLTQKKTTFLLEINFLLVQTIFFCLY